MIATDFLAALPLVLTGLTALLGGYATVVAKRNESKRDKGTERIDLLGASQLSLKEALERADIEGDRLRAEMLRMRNEHEVDRLQWNAKFEAQDHELASVRLQVRACRESLALVMGHSGRSALPITEEPPNE